MRQRLGALLFFLFSAFPFAAFGQQATFTPLPSPNPLTLRGGGPAQTVTVSTQGDAFVGASITYSFSGFPAGIQNDGPKTTTFSQVDTPAYAPVTFSFSAAPGTPGGTYTGTLTGTSSNGVVRQVPFTIFVQQPNIGVSLTQPNMAMCAGGPPQSNSIRLEALNGYQGTPLVEFLNVPSGVAISPNPLPPASLPPTRTIPFTVAANAPGVHSITVRVTDPQFGITRTTTLFVRVTAPDFTATVQPAQVELTPGGAPATVIGTIAPNACMTDAVRVTATAPPELIVTPPTQTMTPPYGPASFSIQAAPNAGPGTYPVTFVFAGEGAAPTRSVTINVTVVQVPDFTIAVTPPRVRVPLGASSGVTVLVAGLNGFTGPVNVSVGPVPGVTFTPATFSMTPGSQPVSIAVGREAVPGIYTVTVTGTAANGTTRTAQFVLEIPAPDFILRATPPALTIAAGANGTIDVSAEGLEGFQGPITVTSNAPAGVILTPASFSLTPGTPQRVNVLVPRSTAPGQYAITFTGTAPGVAAPKTATVMLTVIAPPDFVLLVTPPSISLTQGGTATVTVTAAPSNGFNEPVAVTVSGAGTLNVTPSSFTLAPGASQTVTITAPTNARIGATDILFTGVTPSGLVRVTQLQVTVAPIVPVITAIDPPAVTNGVRSIVVRVTGVNFQLGAIVSSATPGVIVERTEVVSSNAALVTLSVREDASPGPYLLTLRNPAGGVTAPGGTLLVYPRNSIAAPLGVTATAIVFPRTGTIVAADEAVYARGLLATTGSGTIVGEWRLDGAAFDLFTAVVSGGMPTEVRSHVPIPPRPAGASRLELVVTSPQLAVSPAITIAHAVDSASRLELYEPRDGTVIGGAARAPLFRWSLVPGVTGYEVEVFEDDASEAIRFRTSQSEWRPTGEALAEIGTGIRRWRVRPVFPGEVRGEPARWNRFVVLPENLNLQLDAAGFDARTGAGEVRWTGGSPGVIYRIEFVDPATGNVVLSALSLRNDYRVPRALATALRGTEVRVVAVSPEGVVLTTTGARRLSGSAAREGQILRVQATATPQLTNQQPTEGSRVTTDRPRVSAAWNAPVPAEEVALIVGTTDVTAVSVVTPTSVTYEALLPLSTGPQTVRLAAGTLSTSWSFTVAAEEGTPATTPETAPETAPTPSAPTTPIPEPAAPAAPATTIRRDWAVTPIASVAVRSGEEQDSAAVQVSTQADLARNDLSSKVAGDLSFRQPLEGGGDVVQESQNWLANFGARQGAFSEQLALGYAVPDFLDQTQFLTLGTARGGATGKVSTPYGTLSAFQSFESSITGVVAGSFAPVQEVRAFAYEAPTNVQRLVIRAIALDVDEQPGLYSPGGEGDSLGVFARYAINPALNVVAEAARASFQGRGQREQEGDAIRLGVTGTRGKFSYQMNLRRTDADYVNPANRGFTFGSVSDRQGGDVSVTAMFGRTSLGVTARHFASGGGDSEGPEAREDGVTATLSSMLGRILTVSASVNLTADDSDADTARGLPAVDRRVSGGQLTFGQILGRLYLSQTLQYNRTDSREGPFGDALVRGATFTASGPLATFGNLSAFVSAIRSETTPEAGVMDQLMLTLQPSFMIAPYSLSFQPVLSYSRMENDRLAMETSTQSFTPMLTWAPPWMRQALTLQVSGGWRRTETAGQPASEPEPTYGATLSLRWPMRAGAISQPGSTLPGATPIPPPEYGSSNPVHSATTPSGQ